MDKRTLVEFIVAWILVVGGGSITILPLFNISDVRTVFILIIAIYGIIHLFKNFFILSAKEYSGFSTAASCVFVLIILMFLDIRESPWNLALVLFIWIILMSLTRLKESDYYHDRKSNLWILNVFTLILFIFTGILTAVNLSYPEEIQVMILGFFFLINGILELTDPLAGYLIKKKR